MSASFNVIKHQTDMNATEKFTDDVMGSLDGTRRATLSHDAREKILKGMQDAGCGMRDAGYGMRDAGYGTVRIGMIWKIAAVILLLVSLNVFTMVYFNKSSASTAKKTNPVASEYFSYMGTINL